MAKWTLPEGKIYTQADLDAAVAAALREAAKSLADRAEGERQASIYFKEKGRDYKAREAAHVARLMDQHVPRILALIPDAGAALDRAMAAERGRCAKVGETYEQWATDFGPLNPQDVAEHIAAAIRAQGQT